MKKMPLKKLALATGVAAAIAAPISQASIIDNPFFRVLGVVIVWGADAAGNTNATVSDFVLMTTGSGNAGADLIAGNVQAVITGTLTGVDTIAAGNGTKMSVTDPSSGGTFTDNAPKGFLDSSDALSAFGLKTTTDVDLDSNAVQHSFYVASNTAFDIKAVAANVAGTGDFNTLTGANIGYSLAVKVSGDDGLAFGTNAQDPKGTAVGVVAGINNLSDITALTSVYQGGQKTASARGALASQSVRFDTTYTLQDGSGNPYDLSMGAGTLEADVTYTIYVP